MQWCEVCGDTKSTWSWIQKHYSVEERELISADVSICEKIRLKVNVSLIYKSLKYNHGHLVISPRQSKNRSSLLLTAHL